jgi:hypothetical protein
MKYERWALAKYICSGPTPPQNRPQVLELTNQRIVVGTTMFHSSRDDEADRFIWLLQRACRLSQIRAKIQTAAAFC